MCCVIKYALLLLLTCKYASLDSSSCTPSTSLTTYSKLKSSILCDYDTTIRPVADHRNATKLYFQFFIRYFTYDDETSTLSLDVWMRISWVDEHLKWNPDEHDKIDVVYVDTYDIWTPDISVFNRATQGGEPNLIDYTLCPLFSNGTVFCVPSVHIDSLCIPDLRMYPYDTQTCVLRVGSWIYKGKELELVLLKNVVVLSGMEPNGEWEIESFTMKGYAGYYPSIEIKFIIKRLYGAHTASIIIPTIVLYGRDSLLLAGLAIVFTIVFKIIMKLQAPTPSWVSFIVSCATGCLAGRYLFLSDSSLKGVALAKGEEDGDNIIQAEKKMSLEWEVFAKILDFLLLISYIIVYFVLSVKFIP